MNELLKYCPFCYGMAAIQEDTTDKDVIKAYVIYCRECYCTMRDRDKKKLIKRWNRRISNREAIQINNARHAYGYYGSDSEGR